MLPLHTTLHFLAVKLIYVWDLLSLSTHVEFGCQHVLLFGFYLYENVKAVFNKTKSTKYIFPQTSN